MITVNLGEIPADGIHVTGETRQDIFELSESDLDVRAAGPVNYDLYVSEVNEGLLLAQGTIRVTFRLRCVACLEEFPFTVALEDYAADFDEPAGGPLDLTGRIREDLLLELPAYPHCDRDSDDSGRTCPAAGRFDGSRREDGFEPGIWGALDGLKNPDD